MFSGQYEKIKDSMTEREFGWHIVAPVISKIRCGHTSMGMSKSFNRWERKNKPPMFPLWLRIWKDTVVVIGNLHKRDSSVSRGDLVTHINGIKIDSLIDFMFSRLSQDGFADNFNYIKLSSGFSYYYRSIFGTKKEYRIGYKDSRGILHQTTLPAFTPPEDSTQKEKPKPVKARAPFSLSIDSAGKFAVMTVDNFTKWNQRYFFRRSFASLKKNNVPNLILDIRYNGGGRVNASTLLTKYISRKPFKVADSVYSNSNTISPYSRYINGGFFNTLQMILTTKKMSDGKFHFRSLEKKVYKTKKKNHYSGNVYVLTSGPTFSASCLFANAVKGQEGITILGEETGGGWYGNNGILIPDIVLPKTRLRIRLPLFRLVQYNHPNVKGSGIPPDVESKINYESLMKGVDKKMSVAKELIYKKTSSSPTNE
jgi:hypothetical protein